MNCILENTSVLPSSNFVDFIHRASRICLGQSAKALVWRWRQISPLKINIFTLSAPISTNEVSMFKLAIEVCFENHFGLIHAICLSLGSTKSGYFFLGHTVLASKVHEMPFSRQGAQHLRDEFLEERKTQENGHSLCLFQPVQHVNRHPAEETNLCLI